eukprot:46456-Amphidinium_carterae.1
MKGEEEDEIMQDVLCIHYRKDPKGYKEGWWISRDNSAGMGLAWNARAVRGPPTGGWFVIRDRAKLPDPLRIVDPSKANEAYQSRRSEAKKALQALDPHKLKARLVTPDGVQQAA